MSTLNKFAEELKVQREALGLSINDIYEMTRLDKNYIKEMEKGNFEFMPNVYIRAFIRKFANAIELSPEETIKKYEAAKSGKDFNENEVYDLEGKSEKNNEEDSSKTFTDIDAKQDQIFAKNYNPFFIIGFVVVAVLIGIFYFTILDSDNNEIIREQKIEDILSERNNGVEVPRYEIKNNEQVAKTNKKTDIKSTILVNDSLSLKINALDTVWFRIQIDKGQTDEFILNPNRSKTLNAKSQINILIGNAGGTEFLLNGKKLDFIGKKGEIKNVTINSDGIHYLKMKTDLINE